MIITGVDLSKVSNGALTDSIWRMTERNTGGHRVQMGEGLLVTAAAEITGDPDGFVTDADKLAIQSNFADVTFGDVATPNRYSKEAIQNIWDQEGFVRGDATADAINFSVDPSLVGASANGDEPVLDVTSDAPVWELYGVTETHYNNTLATVEEYLEQHQSGDLFVGLDTYPPENIDFHSLLKVYGDQTLDYQMDAVDITRAILDGAMSIPHQTLAVGAQPLTTNIDSVSSTSFALQFFDEARATHYPDRTTPLTELKAGEVNGALNRIGGGSDFNDLTSADFPDLIAGFADVAVDGETTSFSYAAVKRLFNDGVFTRPETAEDAGGIPIAVDREVLSSYASEDTEGNFVGELPTEDAVYTTNEDLETILSAFPGTMTVGTVDIEIVDDIAFENVGEALENLTPTDAPELHHFNQLMQLKTLANDPVRGKQIDIDAVDADITLLLQTEPVTAMYNEAHEVAVLEHFGVGSPEMSAEFTEFATSRSTLQSILRLGEESREFVVNHLVAIAARFDPDGAAKFSEELLPLLIGESIEYAEENGRLLQDGDSVEVVDGETVPTAEAQEKRASSVERWLTYLVSTGRNIGGSNLEWTASIRNLSQSDFKVLTDLVARHSILESAGEDVGELGAYVTANADEFIHDIEDVTALKASGQAMSEASSNGTLPAAWGLLAGISLGLDGYNATQKDELTAADSVQIAADFMQFASGVYGGRHAFAKAGALIADIANEKIINPVLQVLRGAPETEAQELLTTLAEMRNSTDSKILTRLKRLAITLRFNSLRHDMRKRMVLSGGLLRAGPPFRPR